MELSMLNNRAYLMTSSNSKPQNLLGQMPEEWIHSHYSLGKHHSKTEQGIPLKTNNLALGTWGVNEKHLPSRVPTLSTLPWIFLRPIFVFPGLSALPSTPFPAHFQAQPGGKKYIVTCLNSLILWLLLTRREKRSCLQKRLPGAAEATAIRSSPNGPGRWLNNRAAEGAQGS